MSLCNFKHLTAVILLLGMVSVQSVPVQRMTRSGSSAASRSAADPPIIMSSKIRLSLLDRIDKKSRGLFPLAMNSASLAKENILKAQVSLLMM